MQLIIFSGLPGTGKSSIAEAVGRQLSVPVFAKDHLEAALLRSGVFPKEAGKEKLGYAGYELLSLLAERQLFLRQSVILDSVASFERIRTRLILDAMHSLEENIRATMAYLRNR